MTKLIRFSPTSDPRHMQREFDRLFDSFFPTQRGEREQADSAVWAPRLDLVENDEAYLVELDVPGLKKDDISINFHDGMLSVSGERRMSELNEGDDALHVERVYGRFYRSFTLPKAIVEDNIEASYEDGVLFITVPKAEESKPRRISVR